MTDTFYVDIYFATNFLMDLVSLSVGAISASRRITAKRLVLASFLGAAFSTLIALLGVGKLLSVILSVFVFSAMILVCFGYHAPKRLMKPALFSFAGALFLGGAAEAISNCILPRGSDAQLGFGILCGTVLLAVTAYSLWGNHLNRKLDTAVVCLNVFYRGKNEHYYGLVDSGLLLRDPDYGRPVLLLKAEYATPLLPRDMVARMEKGELSGGESLLCVPVRTVGGERNLYAFLPERVQVICSGNRRKKREERDVLIALDFSGGGFGGCPCLVPLSVV